MIDPALTRQGTVRRLSRLAGIALLVCVLSPVRAPAQPAGGVYAIQGARIVPVSGGAVENGTIVVRDGLIEAVGRRAQIPGDAVIIDGTGLTVYPGFIDAYSQAGMDIPSGRDRTYAGNITDELATARFDPASEELETYRRQGFTTALLARNDGVFSGQAALVNLSGGGTEAMTVTQPVAPVLTWSGQPGYPGTLMGVVAYQRQTLIDARYHDMLLQRWHDHPEGMERPPRDPALEALIPAARGDVPFIAEGHSENDLKRLRDLASEYEIRFWIAGAEEAFRVPDLIRDAGVPVIVSLDFPSIQRVTGYWFDRAHRDLTGAEEDELDARDEAAVRGNAAVVQAAGVPLALSTSGMDSPARFLDNLREAVSAGLDPGDALRALTITPARIFGVEGALGTLEPGKVANLTVSRGDLFTEDDASVAYLFVDGRMESYDEGGPDGR